MAPKQRPRPIRKPVKGNGHDPDVSSLEEASLARAEAAVGIIQDMLDVFQRIAAIAAAKVANAPRSR